MVVALGPGKFYGSSLPRPRVYTDVKFPVTDPLISWAQEAHWSMGRHRLQGRIEGNIKSLRSQKETETKTPSPSPPAAPVAVKRRRRIVEEEEEEVEATRRTVRKLKDEFDMAATTVDAQNNPEKEGGLVGRRLIKGLKGSIKRL